MSEFKILSKEEFNPKTVVVNFFLKNEINVKNLASFLPVFHIFKNGKRLKLAEKEKTGYYSHEKVIINIGFHNIIRGLKSKSMHNMISVDLQYLEKNYHFKISKDKIISIGANSIEKAVESTKVLIENINKIQKKINIIKKKNKEELLKNLEFMEKNLNEYLISEIIENEEYEKYNKEILNFYLLYIHDFDKERKGDYFDKIRKIIYEDVNIFNSEILTYKNYGCYNSVYHIQQEKNFILAAHKLAIYLSDMGLKVYFNNKNGDVINISIGVEEKKESDNKNYFHRLAIKNSNIKLTSPSSKDEAYRNYYGVSCLIKKFIDGDIEEDNEEEESEDEENDEEEEDEE